MQDSLAHLTQWLELNPHWIAATIGLTALVESLAWVGILVPGVAVLFAASALAGSLEMAPWACLAAAALGAFAGDSSSFFLGRHAQGPLRRRWPLRQHPQWLERGEAFLARHGKVSIILGRFLGPIRPVLPFTAGALQMPPSRFLWVDGLSSLLWAPAYILPGYLAGRLTRANLETPASPWWLNLSGLALVVLVLALLYLVHKALARPSRHDSPLGRHPRWQAWVSPLNGELPLPALSLLLACLAGFVLVTLTVAGSQPLKPLDEAISLVFRQLRASTDDTFWILLTSWGDSANLLPLSLLIAWRFYRQGDPRGAWHWIGAMLLLAGLNQAFKFGLALPRPEWLQAPLDSFAYPSAHTSNTTLFMALGASFLAQQLPYHRRPWVYALAAVPIGLMGLSRLYLGVHWPTDVLGGVLLGLGVCAATRLSYKRFQRPLRWNRGDTLALASALIWSLAYLWWRYPVAVQAYAPLPLN